MQAPERSSKTPTEKDAKGQRSASRIFASLGGIGLVVYMLFAAGVDPWRWWMEHQSRTDKSSLRHEERVNAASVGRAVQPEPAGTDSSVAESPVPLLLKATRPGRNVREGHAELGVNPASAQTYRAGAILANGARIEEIYSDHVVLARDGQRVSLYVDGHAPAGSPSSDNALAMVGGANRPAPALPNSTDELTDYIRVVPVYQGDAIHALEIYSTERSGVFAALGLEPGDRITGIDGEAVTDPSVALASLRRLTQGAALQVTLERGGRSQTISLNGLILTAARSAGTE